MEGLEGAGGLVVLWEADWSGLVRWGSLRRSRAIGLGARD